VLDREAYVRIVVVSDAAGARAERRQSIDGERLARRPDLRRCVPPEAPGRRQPSSVRCWLDRRRRELSDIGRTQLLINWRAQQARRERRPPSPTPHWPP
jgi:hypothetical protein